MKKIIILMVSIFMLIPQNILVKAEESNTSSTQDFANIVVFAHFSDDTQDDADTYFNSKYATFKKYFDGSNGQSLKSYMSTISQGKFSLHNYFPQEVGGKITSVALKETMDKGKTEMIDQSIVDQVVAAIPSLENQVVDYDGDGKVDNLYIVVKAEGCSDIQNSGVTLVAHSSTYQGSIAKYNGKGIFDINVVSTDRMELSKTGLLTHEFLHTFGYPDLYTNTGATNPVYLYDLMGAVSPRPSLTLAYLRSTNNTNADYTTTKWVTLPEISDTSEYENNTQTITLNTFASDPNNQACILKSPLNDREFFVVEYRKATADRYSEDALDGDILYPGLIVYRVDTTIEGLSNKTVEGKPAIYVFRPQEGQNGYNSNEKICMQYATLSQETGRTSIGSSDLDKRLVDGALTYNDDSNSGIVISNVGSASGDTITFDVSIPQKDQFDIWENMNYIDTPNYSSKTVTMEYFNNSLCVASMSNYKISFNKYDEISNTWKNYANDISLTSSISNMKLFTVNNELYLSYLYGSGYITILKYNGINSFNEFYKTSYTVNEYDIISHNGSIYYVYSDGTNAYLCKIDGTNNESIKSLKYHNASKEHFLGQTKIAEYNGQLYVLAKDVSNGAHIKLYSYDEESDTFTNIDDDKIYGSAVNIQSIGSKLYLSLASTKNKLQVVSYDGTTLNIGKESDIDSSEAKIVKANNHLYIINFPSTSAGKLQAYLYEDDTYTNEGEAIDSYGNNLSIVDNGKTIYLSYVIPGDTSTINVKKKEINVNNIKKKNLNTASITKASDFTTSNGNVAVTIGDITLNEGTDYTKTVITKEDGSVYVTLSAIAGTEFEGSVTKVFKDISKTNIVSKDVTYTGNEVTNKVIVRDGYDTLIEGTDYTLSYSNNTNKGLGTVTIMGTGDYYGSVNKIFNICEDTGEKLTGYSLNLKGKIGFNFYFTLKEELLNDNGAYIQFIMPDGTTNKVFIKDGESTNNGYRFTCYLTASEMTQYVKFKVITSDNTIGKEYQYNILDYIESVSKMSNPAQDKLMNLMNSMLNYGGYAQVLFDKYTNHLANYDVKDNFEDSINSIKKGDFLNYKAAISNSGDGVSVKGLSLQLKASTLLRVYFNFEDESKIAQYDVTLDGKKVDLQKSENGYYVLIDNVRPMDLAQKHTITVGNLQIECSALSYAYIVIDNEDFDQNLQDTIKALYLYYQNSKEYFK